MNDRFGKTQKYLLDIYAKLKLSESVAFATLTDNTVNFQQIFYNATGHRIKLTKINDGLYSLALDTEVNSSVTISNE